MSPNRPCLLNLTASAFPAAYGGYSSIQVIINRDAPFRCIGVIRNEYSRLFDVHREI